jgi:hypothetical protein
MADAGFKVNTTTKQRFWDGRCSPAGPKPPIRVPVAGKRQTGPTGGEHRTPEGVALLCAITQ